jgi:pimeloyl-ACP methyl ester carboxylesterase
VTAGAQATPPSPDAAPGLTALSGPVASPGPQPPIPHWPERMVSLPNGERVFVAETAAGVRDEEKDPVLCVHGMAGAATNWTDFMAELTLEFACAAVDLPGSGQSPPPKGPGGYSIRALANTVIGLIEARGDGPVHLVGNSMGGAVSVKVAALRPDLVRTLTLISPALPDRLPHPSLLRFPMLATPGLGGWMLRCADSIPAQARVRLMLSTVYYDPTSVHPDRIAAEVDQTRRRDKLPYSDEVLIGAARTIAMEYLRPAARSLWHDAERVRVPVLAIYGSHDRLVNPRMAARAARTFRDAHVLVLPRTGHVAMLEHPAEVAVHFREMVKSTCGTRARETERGMPGIDAGFTPVTNF